MGGRNVKAPEITQCVPTTGAEDAFQYVTRVKELRLVRSLMGRSHETLHRFLYILILTYPIAMILDSHP